MVKLILLSLLILIFPLLLRSQDYYFVSGQDGKWSNIQNWRTTSGGNVQHNQIPTSNDNIIVDDNSFSGGVAELVIDLNIVTCHNISITTTQPFNFRINENNTLIISGGVSGLSNTNYDFRGNLEFNGSGTKDINFGKIIRAHQIKMGESQGIWNVSSDWFVEDILTITDGNISFTNMEISANQMIFDPFRDLKATFDEVDINLRGTDKQIFYAYSKDYTLQFGQTDLIDIQSTNSIITIDGDYPSIQILGNKMIEWDRLDLTAHQYAIINFEDISGIQSSLDVNTLNLNGNTKIFLNTSARQVLIAPGSSIELLTGGDFVWQNIQALGTCLNQISISSGQAKIQTQNSEIEHAVLVNLTFTGKATATETSLVGSTTGITVTNNNPGTYYWVNGQGDWSDANHWSRSTGGPPAGCIPSGKDQVVFDNQSFAILSESVTISGNAYVNDIRWDISQTGNSILLEASANLFINGSMIMTQKALFHNQGIIHFVSAEEEMLDTKDSEIDGKVTFNGIGSWTLLSNFTSVFSMEFSAGSIIFNSFQWTNNQFLSRSEQNRTLDLTNSRWVFDTKPGDYSQYSEIDKRGLTVLNTGSHTFFQNGSPFLIRNIMGAEIAPFGLDTLTVMGLQNFLQIQQGVNFTADHVDLQADVIFDGTFEFGEMKFHQSHSYSFNKDATIQAQTVTVEKRCPGSILFYGLFESSPGKLNFPKDTEVPGLVAQNMHVETGSIHARGGKDNGNNQGIDFETGPGRTLFWVGGTGGWTLSDHWSLASGGVGGECPPGPQDDVIFDNRSFTDATEIVNIYSGGLATCHNLTWKAGTSSSNILIQYILYIFGSVTLGKTLNTSNSGSIYFMSSEEETHLFKESIFSNFLLFGSGTVNFDEGVSTSYFHYYNGKLNINHSILNVAFFNMDIDVDQSMVLNHSILHLDDPTSYSYVSILNNGHSYGIENRSSGYTEFLNKENQINIYSASSIGKVYIRNPESNNILNAYDQSRGTHGTYLEITGNNTFNGAWELDTLIVHPGHHLIFSGITHMKVNNYYRYVGNNCLSSTWRNLNPAGASQVNFEVKSGTEVLQDHIQMNGITGSSPVELLAGSHSTNVLNSNPGWIFDNQVTGNEENGILGPDITFCQKVDKLILNENNRFNATAITWNETFSDTEFPISDPGEYRVHVSYASGCELYDTIQVSLLAQIDLDLGDDRVLCEGDSVILSPLSSANGYKVIWNTNDSTVDILVTAPGMYRVTVSSDQCEVSDSVNIEVLPVPDIQLAKLLDTARCEGDFMTLDLITSGYAALWQGDTVRSPVTIDQSGHYTARLVAGQCFDEDEINITFYPPPDYEIIQPEPVCQGESSAIRVNSPGNSILWEDGSVDFDRMVAPDASKNYTFELKSPVCVLQDSVTVAVLSVPVTNLIYPKDVLCGDETLILEASSTGDRVEWADGTTGDSLIIDQPGNYSIKGYLDGCIDSASVVIRRIDPVDLELRADTTICEDEEVALQSQVQELDNIRWNGTPGEAIIMFSGERTVLLEALDRGCPVSDSIRIHTMACGPSEIALPNAFSPNGDGQNDRYRPVFDPSIVINEYLMQIFDRWGNLIFSTVQPEDSWDGQQLEGVFAVSLDMEYTNSSNRKYHFEDSGEIVILR